MCPQWHGNQVIGRGLGNSVVVDPVALPATIGGTGAASQVEAKSDEDRPQPCPDASAEYIAGRSADRHAAH
jgi:hypothetical protein